MTHLTDYEKGIDDDPADARGLRPLRSRTSRYVIGWVQGREVPKTQKEEKKKKGRVSVSFTFVKSRQGAARI